MSQQGRTSQESGQPISGCVSVLMTGSVAGSAVLAAAWVSSRVIVIIMWVSDDGSLLCPPL